MTTTMPPPGWHPDPSDPTNALRWWDGMAWTAHTQPAQTQPAQTQPAPATAGPTLYGQATMVSGYPAQVAAASYRPAPARPVELSFAKRNAASLTAMAVVALYVLIAMSTKVVMLGIFPVLLSVRAVREKEALAPFAVIAAVIAVGVAVVALR